MQAMENEVSQALRGGSQDDVLSEGFRLTITRKDLQTLSHLNWLNDEVSVMALTVHLYHQELRNDTILAIFGVVALYGVCINDMVTNT